MHLDKLSLDIHQCILKTGYEREEDVMQKERAHLHFAANLQIAL